VGTLPTHHPTVDGIRCSGVPPRWPSRWRLHASTAPKMHSFVHGLFSPNPTPPHHEPTASTALPSASICRGDLLKHKVLSLQGLSKVLVTEGSKGSAVCEGGGRGAAQHVRVPLLRVGSWALATGPSPRCTRGWMICCSVDGRQSRMALKSFGRAPPPCMRRFYASATAFPQRWAVAWRA
jgi:hypothetical protein